MTEKSQAQLEATQRIGKANKMWMDKYKKSQAELKEAQEELERLNKQQSENYGKELEVSQNDQHSEGPEPLSKEEAPGFLMSMRNGEPSLSASELQAVNADLRSKPKKLKESPEGKEFSRMKAENNRLVREHYDRQGAAPPVEVSLTWQNDNSTTIDPNPQFIAEDPKSSIRALEKEDTLQLELGNWKKWVSPAFQQELRECRERFVGVAKKVLLDANLSGEKSVKAGDAVKAVSLEQDMWKGSGISKAENNVCSYPVVNCDGAKKAWGVCLQLHEQPSGGT